MSHFTCFTVGDVDEIMARYNEQDEKYFDAVEYTEDEIKETLNYYKNDEYKETNDDFVDKYPDSKDRTEVTFYSWYENSTPCYDEEALQKCIDAKERCFLVKDGKIVKSYHFYNPNAKYDYYGVIGDDPFCRWGDTGFRLKNGETVQCGRIGDLDIDGTIKDEIESRRNHYRKVFDGVGKLNHTPWPKYLERRDKGEINIDEARELYHAQPDVKRFNEWCRKENYWLEPDNYLCTEDEYVEFTTFPVFCANILGQWLEKGEMGWWGIVTDKKEPKNWKEVIETALHDAQKNHPDELFHVLDCHI